MAITTLKSNTEINNLVTQLYREMISIDVENDNESLILLEIYSNDICIYKHEVLSGTHYIDTYLEDGDNEIKIIATDNESSKTINGNIEVNIYSYQHDSEPILSNFIGNDGDKLHLELDKAKLTYLKPKAGENIQIAIDKTIASNFFKVIGENSEYYQIDTNNIPLIQGDIIRRPLHVIFDGVSKVYDGTSDISFAYKTYEHDQNYYFIDPQNTQIDYRDSAIVHEAKETKQNYKVIYNMNDFIMDNYEFVDEKEIDFSSVKIGIDNMIGYSDKDGNINFLCNTNFITQEKAESIIKTGYPKGLYYFIAHTNRSDIPTCNDVSITSNKLFGEGISGSTIKVVFYDGYTTYTIVDENGNWSIDVPSEVKLNRDKNIGKNIYISQTTPGLIESVILKKIILESLISLQTKAPIVYPIHEQDTYIEGEGISGADVTIIFPDGLTIRDVYVQNGKWKYEFTEEDDNPLLIECKLSLLDNGITTNTCEISLDDNNNPTITSTKIDTGCYIEGEIVNNKTIKLYFKYKNILNIKSYQLVLPFAKDLFTSIKESFDEAFKSSTLEYDEEKEVIICNGENDIGFINESKNICTLVIELNSDISDKIKLEFSRVEILENRAGNNGKALTFYQTEPYKGKSVDVIVGITEQSQSICPIINPINEYSDLIEGEGIPGSIIELRILDEIGDEIFRKSIHDELPIEVLDDNVWWINVENIDIKEGYKVIAIQHEENKLPSYETTTYVNVGEVTPCLTINSLINDDIAIIGNGIPNAMVQLSSPNYPIDDEFLIPDEPIYVDEDGDWEYILSNYDKSKFTHGIQIVGKQKELNKRISGDYTTEVKIQSYDMSIAPTIDPILEGDKIISGIVKWDKKPTSSEGQESYLFIWHNSNFIKKIKVKQDGNWSIKIPTNLDLIENDIIQVTNLESLDGESMITTTEVTRSNNKRSDTPCINTVSVLSTKITGTGISNSTIEIFINGQSIKHGIKVNDNNWEYSLPKRITLNPDDEIKVIQRESNKIRSKDVITYVQDKEISDAPTVFPIKETDKYITGKGISDSTITLYYDKKQEDYITTKVDKNNGWKIDVSNSDLVLSDNKLYFTQTEIDKKESQIVTTQVKSLDYIPVFTVNDWIESDEKDYIISGTGVSQGKISLYADDKLIIGPSNGNIILDDSTGVLIEKEETGIVDDYIYVNSSGNWKVTIQPELHQLIKGKTLKFKQELNDNYYPSIITITNTLDGNTSTTGLTERITYLYDTFNDKYYTDNTWDTNSDFLVYNNSLYFGLPEYKGTRPYGNVTPSVNSKDCTYRVQLYDSSKTTITGTSISSNNGILKTVYADVRKGQEIVVDLPYTYRAVTSKEMTEFQKKYSVTIDTDGKWLFPSTIDKFKQQISPYYKLVDTGYNFYDVQIRIEWPITKTPLYCVITKLDREKQNRWLIVNDEIVNISIINHNNKLLAQASTDYGIITVPNSLSPEYDALENNYRYIREKGLPVKAITNRYFDNFTMEVDTKVTFYNDATEFYNHGRDYLLFGIMDSNKRTDEFRIYLQNDISINHVRIDSDGTEEIDDLGYAEILNNKKYRIKVSCINNIFSITINDQTFSVKNLITSGNRRIYIGSRYTEEQTIDNVHIYYDKPITHQYNWQLVLSDDFNYKSFRQWTSVPNYNTKGFSITKQLKKHNTNYYLSASLDKYTTKDRDKNMLRLCQDYSDDNELILNYFELEFDSFTDFNSPLKDGTTGNFSIGIMDSNTKDIQFIKFNNMNVTSKYNNSTTTIGSYPFNSTYYNTYGAQDYVDENYQVYNIRLIVTDQVEVYIKKSSDSYWQYIGSTKLSIGDKREIVIGYDEVTLRMDDIKVYQLPNTILNDVIESDEDEEIHLSIPMFDCKDGEEIHFPIEGDYEMYGRIFNEQLPDAEDYVKTIYVKVDDRLYSTTNIVNNKWYVKFDSPLKGNEQICIYQNDTRIGNSLFVIFNSNKKDMSTPLAICSISEDSDEITGYALANTKYNDIIISIPNNGSYHVLLNEDEQDGYVTWNLPISTNKIKLKNGYEISVTGYERILQKEIDTDIHWIYELEEASKISVTTSVIVKRSRQSEIPLVNSICEKDKTILGKGIPNSQIYINIPELSYDKDNMIDGYTYTNNPDIIDVDESGNWIYTIPDDVEIIADVPIKFNQLEYKYLDEKGFSIPYSLSQDVIYYIREYKPSITPVIYPVIDYMNQVTIRTTGSSRVFTYIEDKLYESVGDLIEFSFNIDDDSLVKAGNIITSSMIEMDVRDNIKDKGYEYSTTITRKDQIDTPILYPITEEDTIISGKGIPDSTIYITMFDTLTQAYPNTYETNVDSSGNWIFNLPYGVYITDTIKFTIYQTKTNMKNSEYITTYSGNLYFENTLTLNTPITDEAPKVPGKYLSGTGLVNATIKVYVNDEFIGTTIVDNNGYWGYTFDFNFIFKVNDKITIIQEKESVDNKEIVETYVTYVDNKVIGVNATKDPVEIKQFNDVDTCEKWLLNNNDLKWIIQLQKQGNKYIIRFNKATGYEIQDKAYIVYKYLKDNDTLIRVNSDKEYVEINTQQKNQTLNLQKEIQSLFINNVYAHFASKNVTSVLAPIYIDNMHLVDSVNSVIDTIDNNDNERCSNYQIKSYSAFGEITRKRIDINVKLLDKIYDGSNYIPFKVDIPNKIKDQGNDVINKIEGDDIYIECIYDNYSNDNKDPQFFNEVGNSWIEVVDANVGKKGHWNHHFVLEGKDANNYTISKINWLNSGNISKRDVELQIHVLRYIRATGKFEIEYEFINDIKSDNLTILFNSPDTRSLQVSVPQILNNGQYDWNNTKPLNEFFNYVSKPKDIEWEGFINNNDYIISDGKIITYWNIDDRQTKPNTKQMDINVNINSSGIVQLSLDGQYYEDETKQYKLFDGQLVKVTNMTIHPEHPKKDNYKLLTEEIICKIEII